MILADLLAFLFEANPNDHVSIVVESMDNVIVSARNPMGMVYDIKYLDDGLFRVDYTPRVSGLYSASIKINDMYLWTDHSFGVIIDPTYASAHHSTHNSNAVAVAGAEQLIDVVLRDRFDNRIRLGLQVNAIILTRSMSQQLQ